MADRTVAMISLSGLAPITDAPMPMTLIFFAAMRQYAVFHIVVLAKDK